MDLLDFLLIVLLVRMLGELEPGLALLMIALGWGASLALCLETRPMTPEERAPFTGEDETDREG